MVGRLRGGRTAPVVLVGASFDDSGEGAFGHGGVPAQGGLHHVGAALGVRRLGLREFACEVPHQVVRCVAAVGLFLQERHVDEAVQGGFGAGFVGAGEAGQQGAP